MDYRELPRLSVKPRKNRQKVFDSKSPGIQKLIREALQIMKALGLPIDELTDRKKERAAMAFLSVGCVKKSSDWKKIKDTNDNYSVTTREIIAFDNQYLGDDISSGSYDDIRRSDLKQLLIAGIVVPSKQGANLSNPTRGYKINVEYSRIIRKYGNKDWFQEVETFNSMRPSYQERLKPKRNLQRIEVRLPNGEIFHLKDGEHNAIQKLVVEKFLPIYGFGAEILYIGDSSNKFGIRFERERLETLGFGDLTQGKLPDIVAYSAQRDWIYMIEAYHTSNPITPERKLELARIMGKAVDKAIFVTAFENLYSYRTCPEELAWETEVWIATEPEHIIHRDGDKFLGPYGNPFDLQKG